MSDSFDAKVVDWLSELTEGQTRALSHQVGIAGSVTYPIDKLCKTLLQRKNMKRVKKVYEEHYVQ
ncbi:MAG: hypothetical protein ACYSW8_11045 [Planctomycetota bacterium]|jgi:hypothetical protein